jgi:hypothetical protein
MQLLFVGGHSGAGKTSLLKCFVHEFQDKWVTCSSAPPCATGWLQFRSGSGGIAVFGRFQGYHKTAEVGNAAGGKIDGCDRLHATAIAPSRAQIPILAKQGIKLIIADGPKLLQQTTIDIAGACGYTSKVLEVSTPQWTAAARKKQREPNATERALAQNVWPSMRSKFASILESGSQQEILQKIRAAARHAMGEALPAGRVVKHRRIKIKPAAFNGGLSADAKERRRQQDRERKRKMLLDLYKRPAAHQAYLTKKRSARAMAMQVPEAAMLRNYIQRANRS